MMFKLEHGTSNPRNKIQIFLENGFNEKDNRKEAKLRIKR